MPVVVFSTNLTDLRNELEDSVEGNVTEAGYRAKGISLHQSGYDSGAFKRA
jgi:hypothetical protein